MAGWDIIVVPFSAQPRDDFVGGMVDVLRLAGAEEDLFGGLTYAFWGALESLGTSDTVSLTLHSLVCPRDELCFS